jgi:MFS family permease
LTSNTDRSFRLFLCSRIATNIAVNMVAVAVSWQVYEITDSALALGLIGLVQFLPTVLLVLAVGHVADRYDRRMVTVYSLFVEALMAAAIVGSLLFHAASAALLFVVSAAIATARAFEAPTAQAFMPELVPRERLASAMAHWAAANRVATIAGPALGGFLYAVSPIGVYAIATAFFLIAALLQLVTKPTQVRVRTTVAPTWGTVFAGFRFVAVNRLFLGAMTLDLFATLFAGATALLPIYARDILATGPWGLGLLRSAPAAGALLVTLALARYPIRRHNGVVLFGAIGAFGAATIVFALSRSFVLALAALAIVGLADVVNVLIRVTLIQLAVPDAMRGRVNAINSMFANSSNQLGQVESGLIAAWLGAVPSALIGGIASIVVALVWMRLFPELRRIDRLETVTTASHPSTSSGSQGVIQV